MGEFVRITRPHLQDPHSLALLIAQFADALLNAPLNPLAHTDSTAIVKGYADALFAQAAANTLTVRKQV